MTDLQKDAREMMRLARCMMDSADWLALGEDYCDTAEKLPQSPIEIDHIGRINDAVNHPQHYTQGGIECIDALKAATAGLEGIEAVCTANAIKYLWRWKHKNGVEDINKAIWYLKRLREEVEKSDER